MDFKVRAFREEDLPEIVKAFIDGFISRDETVDRLNKFNSKLVDDVVKLFIEIGDLVLVAEADRKARGVLIGYFPNGFRFEKISGFASNLVSSFSMISNCRTISTLLDGFIYSFQFSLFYTSKPSILLLTSQKDFRCGIGTALMDRWIEKVEREGYDSTIVGTDERLNWRFYEKYGFERDKTFKLKPRLFSRPMEKISGYIYNYDVRNDLKRDRTGKGETGTTKG